MPEACREPDGDSAQGCLEAQKAPVGPAKIESELNRIPPSPLRNKVASSPSRPLAICPIAVRRIVTESCTKRGRHSGNEVIR